MAPLRPPALLLLPLVLVAAWTPCAQAAESSNGRPPLNRTGLVFGTATSACQCEGAAREGGRGPSIWDTFSQQHPAEAHLFGRKDTFSSSWLVRHR